MKKGKLYIVSTPIGNLGDITYRAVQLLSSVAFVLAEDTRETKKLFNKYEIETTIVSYRDQNHSRILGKILEKLDMGLDLALVSDSGTPLISDPGYLLVSYLKEKGYEVLSVPGPNAVISALSVSGLPTDSFLFLGFLPKSQSRRESVLEKHKDLSATIILYESPKRLKKLLELVYKVLGNRKVSIANDLTKLYELTVTGAIKDILDDWTVKEKGEFVVLISKKE